MKRRNLIKGGVLATVLSAGGGLFAWLTLGHNSRLLIRSIVEKNIGLHITLESKGVERFIEDMFRLHESRRNSKWQILCTLSPVYLHTNILQKGPIKDYIWWLERDIVHAFLMGSDFFFQREEYESGRKSLEYTGFKETHIPACLNPFAARE